MEPSASPRWRAHPRCCGCCRSADPGRIFTEEDGEVDKNRKVILSAEAWHQLFGARENAVEGDLRINGEPHTVVGVLPAGFLFRDPDVKLWLPLAFTAADKGDDRRHSNNWSYSRG